MILIFKVVLVVQPKAARQEKVTKTQNGKEIKLALFLHDKKLHIELLVDNLQKNFRNSKMISTALHDEKINI